MDSHTLAQYIDHTLLRAEASADELRTLCVQARTHSFYSVCIPSWYIPQAKELLSGSGVKTITVVGFPLGHSHTMAKVAETRAAIELGADEIDMVVNLGALKAGQLDVVTSDIAAVVAEAVAIPVKVILETAALTIEELRAGAKAAQSAGAAFVKTSTGFHPAGGATIQAVRALRECVGEKMGVKASGGIRSHQDALQMIEAGASRLGTSASVTIVTAAAATGAVAATTSTGDINDQNY